MTTNQYRGKQAIRAWKWDGEATSIPEGTFPDLTLLKLTPILDHSGMVKFREYHHIVIQVGDWICEHDDELWGMSDSEFRATYVAVGEEGE